MMNYSQPLALRLMFLVVMVCNIEAQVQDNPWTKWTEKQARKILDDSPWVKVQTNQESKTPTPISPKRDSIPGPKDFGDVAYIRLLSAKPIRMAYVRLTELER